MRTKEGRVWRYLLDNQTATAEEVADACSVSESYARRQIARIGTPIAVREDTMAAKQAAEGRKDDADKIRMELIPSELLFAVGAILTFGAEKYDDRNWEKGMSWGRVFGASMRHLWAWWGGKGPTTKNFVFGDLDLETGMSHLWHAGCCITFLIAYEERGAGTDDRHTTQTGE